MRLDLSISAGWNWRSGGNGTIWLGVINECADCICGKFLDWFNHRNRKWMLPRGGWKERDGAPESIRDWVLVLQGDHF